MSWDDYNINAGNYFSEITHMNTLNALRLALIERAERVNADVTERLQKEVVRMVDINWLADFENLLDSCIPKYINFFLETRPFFLESTLLTAIGDTERISPGRFLTFAWAWQRYKMINCLIICYYTLIANTHNNDNRLYIGNYTEGWYRVTYVCGAYNTISTDTNNKNWNYASFDHSGPWNNNLWVKSETSRTRLDSFSSYTEEFTYSEAESYYQGKSEYVYLSGATYFYIDDWSPHHENNGGTVTIKIEGNRIDNAFEYTAHDSDGDGQPDWYEIEISETDPLDSTDMVDTDGDGFSDYEENLSGTDVAEPNDNPQTLLQNIEEEATISINNTNPQPTITRTLKVDFSCNVSGNSIICNAFVVKYGNGCINSYKWGINGAAPSAGSRSKSYTGLTANSYTIVLQVSDTAGGTATTSHTVTITQKDIEKNKKRYSKSTDFIYVDIWADANSYISGDTATINYSGSSNVANVALFYTAPESSETSLPDNKEITNLVAGTYTARIVAIGTNGDTKEDSCSFSVIDSTSEEGQKIQNKRDYDVTVVYQGDDGLYISGRSQESCNNGISATFDTHVLSISGDTYSNMFTGTADGVDLGYFPKGGFGSSNGWSVIGWSPYDVVDGEPMIGDDFVPKREKILTPEEYLAEIDIELLPNNTCYAVGKVVHSNPQPIPVFASDVGLSVAGYVTYSNSVVLGGDESTRLTIYLHNNSVIFEYRGWQYGYFHTGSNSIFSFTRPFLGSFSVYGNNGSLLLTGKGRFD